LRSLIAAYLFYYWNMPSVPSTNQTLRLIFAPTYLDTELGLKDARGKDTDLLISLPVWHLEKNPLPNGLGEVWNG
jgi:hypothetical protein